MKDFKEKVDGYLEQHFENIESLRKAKKVKWEDIATHVEQNVLEGNSVGAEYIRTRFRKIREKKGEDLIPEKTRTIGYSHAVGTEFIGSTTTTYPTGMHFEYKENKAKGEAEYKFTSDHTPTEQEIIDWFKIDTKKFRINQIYHKTSFGGKYSITVSLLAVKGAEAEDYIGKFEKFVDNYNKTIFLNPHSYQVKEHEQSNDDVLYLATLADLHIGNYQKRGYTERIKERVLDTFDSIAENTTRIAILNTGDILHTDTSKSQTYQGTQLDSETDFEDAFTEGLELITSIIDHAAALVKNVTFINVRGNHSFDTEYCLGEALKKIYKNQKNIEIINQKETRIYYYWNNNAFLFTHGDKAVERLPLIFATEGREVFQKADNHHIILGHLHHTKSKQYVNDAGEFAGISVRVVGSPSSNDIWHKREGFVQNKKSLTTMVFTPQEGKYAEFQFKL